MFLAYLLGLATLPVLGVLIFCAYAAFSSQDVGREACQWCDEAGIKPIVLEHGTHLNAKVWLVNQQHILICRVSVRHRKAVQRWCNEKIADGDSSPFIIRSQRKYGWRKTANAA